MILRAFPIALRAALIATISISCSTRESDKPSAAGSSKRTHSPASIDSSRTGVNTYRELVSGRLPALPSVEKGICPFECCQFGKWTADDSVDVFAVERDSSSRFSRVPAGTVIVADSGNLYTVNWGIAVLQRSADVHEYLESALDGRPFSAESSFVLERGDTVVHAGHIPESGLILMIRGRAYLGSEFWATADDLKDSPALDRMPALLIQELREEWWVHVRVGNRSGWIDAYHSKIRGSDACE